MGSMVSGLVLLTTVSLSGADGFWQPLALKYKLGYQSATPATRYSYSRKYDTWCKGLVPDYQRLSLTEPQGRTKVDRTIAPRIDLHRTGRTPLVLY